MGVIGGGQLARMMQPAAVALGVRLRVLAESDNASAAQVVPEAQVGDHRDAEAVAEFALGCDVVTFDHEHVPTGLLTALERDGIAVRPGSAALVHAQDKSVMRARLAEMGVPCPRWRMVHDVAELEAFGARVGWPVVLKTPRGGYDGKGVLLVGSAAEAADWLSRSAADPDLHGGGLLAEERIGFRRELAALVARSPAGQAAAWPVVETVQVGGVCDEVIAPAPGLDPDVAAQATEIALKVAGELDVVGVLAVELFEVAASGGESGGESSVVVNELAMRPHNSGHWTIDGAVTSQFEQHLRAVLDLPLGDPRPRARWSVMVNVLGGDYPDLYRSYLHVMARDPGVKVHMYGKDVRPGRKIGHVTVSGDDLDQLRARARHAADFIAGVIDE
ncbi:MAG TPA: 5-(carboxyamino)imidazole ribonucleotide synthase [Kineosporiaceae bacterium]|nr:5-(carboxyamino)imidazole ribonucleotide synthase [Kineosporiaceae bacterium]